jgi:hypothetical protein
MREFHYVAVDSERLLEDATRIKQQLDADRWRSEIRPGALQVFAARAANLTWSRALLKAVVEELYPDDLFTELAGSLDHVPLRRCPHVLAVAVALRHSWRRDGLIRLAKRLRISLAEGPRRASREQPPRPSRFRLSGSLGSRQRCPRRIERVRRSRSVDESSARLDRISAMDGQS